MFEDSCMHLFNLKIRVKIGRAKESESYFSEEDIISNHTNPRDQQDSTYSKWQLPSNQQDGQPILISNNDSFVTKQPSQRSFHDEFAQSFKLKSAKKRKRLYNEAVKPYAPKLQKSTIKKRKKPSTTTKRESQELIKLYDCQKEGRKNITKNVGMQLRRFLMMQSIQPEVAKNQTIQNFINPSKDKQLNYSLESFKKLSQDSLASQLSRIYMDGNYPIIDLMDSTRITDIRWNLRQIQFFRSLISQ